MKIIFKTYHFFNKTKGVFEKELTKKLVLKNGRIYSPPHHKVEFNKSIPFEIEKNILLGEIKNTAGEVINYTHKIIDKDLSYQLQREFYIEASWFNRQKLKLMLGNHWLQKENSVNVKWIITTMIAVAGIIISISKSDTKEVERAIMKLDSTQEQILQNETTLTDKIFRIQNILNQKNDSTRH